jgi:hypothetical protein
VHEAAWWEEEVLFFLLPEEAFCLEPSSDIRKSEEL